MRNASLVLSVIFHPLLMTSYGCAFLLFGLHGSVYDYLTPDSLKWRITFLVASMTFLLPVLNIYLLYKLDRLPSFMLSNRKDRTYPYMLSALFYFGLVYLLYDVNVWNILKAFIAGAGLAILLSALINLRYKISAHMVGLGGMLGFMISVSYLLKTDITPLYILVVLVAGLTGSARMILEEHDPLQLLSGFLLGCGVQCTLFFILRQISFTSIL
ncbi:MAG TPA: hypothetical protein PLQ93_04435 [Bacteroidia bacterium]|nr:hypothetical protein [Bacteroidia bacterium]